MEDTKKGNTTNATVDLVAEALTDLPLAKEQAGETKGGAVTQSNKLISFKASDPNTL